MASEEDLKVAAEVVNVWRHSYYAISERLKETPIAVADLAEAIATALTAARAEQQEVDAGIAESLIRDRRSVGDDFELGGDAACREVAAAIRAGKE